ncbi:MAG: efflux RND transporter periplasmic adaptor subunit [Desulfopila sp.]|jgi:RND family efflux transporter MFP subunit|nr:efflux RND transporter periplasmic adaptor subunit [Desulfopila sp.]
MGTVGTEVVAETQSSIGILYYERKSEVSSDVAGLVDAVLVDQGDRVKKGEVLVRLDTELLELEISLTATRMKQIELRVENTRKNLNRIEKMYQKAGVSEKVFDDALFDYEDAVKERLAMQDSMKKLLLNRERSAIKAPFDGIVLSKNIDVGGWAQQGKGLITLGSSADLYVRAPVAENLLQFVEIGQQVPVVINAFAREVTGTLVNIDPVADVKTKNVFLKINIPHQPLVAENMSATVMVSSSSKRELRTLKRAALVKFQGKDFVYTVKEDKAAILPVNIVAYLGDRIGVDDPHIVAGMKVVVEGNERLRPDQPVTVAGEK